MASVATFTSWIGWGYIDIGMDIDMDMDMLLNLYGYDIHVLNTYGSYLWRTLPSMTILVILLANQVQCRGTVLSRNGCQRGQRDDGRAAIMTSRHGHHLHLSADGCLQSNLHPEVIRPPRYINLWIFL
jgi:hypothetical protein